MFQMSLPDDPQFRNADLSVHDGEGLGKVKR